MKVKSVNVPTIEEIKELSAYQRKNDNIYCINSASRNINATFLSYVDENGIIVSSGKKYYGESVRIIIDLELEENEKIGVGDIIEFNNILFVVVEGNKAISLENVAIPDIFDKVFSTTDPNKGNNLFWGYKVNSSTLSTWLENSNKQACLIENKNYNFEEHNTAEKELFKEVIKYTYQYEKEIEERRYGNKDAKNWELTEEKMNIELETPNIYASELISFFINAIKEKYSIEVCAVHLLKRNHMFSFDVDPDNLTGEQQDLLSSEIQKIQKIYLLALKYNELNKEYDGYLSSLFEKKNNQVHL